MTTRGTKVSGGAAAGKPRGRIAVDGEQRRLLIETCAFFRAERFREVEPGCYREHDVQAAAADIDAVIAPRRRRARKP